MGNETVTLGYSPTDHRVALQLRVETQPFLPGNCPATDTGQLLFPHQVKSLHPGQRGQLNSRYIWHSIMGPLTFYKGSSFVQLIQTNGFLPFFPNQAVGSADLRNPLPPSQLAVDDIYEAMRTWFYQQEPDPSSNWNSLVRSIGVYDNPQFNTYQQGLSSLIESVMIADQLANSTQLTGNDTSTNNVNACLCKPKRQVAAEMRTTIFILDIFCELLLRSGATIDHGSTSTCRSLTSCARMSQTTTGTTSRIRFCEISVRSTAIVGPMAQARAAPTRNRRAKLPTLPRV